MLLEFLFQIIKQNKLSILFSHHFYFPPNFSAQKTELEKFHDAEITLQYNSPDYHVFGQT